MNPLLFTSITELASKVLDRWIPDKQKQAEAQLELQKELLAYDWKGIELEFADRANARALAEKEIASSSPVTAFLAAIVRPVWGIGAFALVTYSLTQNYAISPEINELIKVVIQFYFGGRVIEKIIPTVASALKKS